ncbi:type VI secretion system protein TssA [Martelella alba]|uniref:Type VI secretion system protein TssA n=1 Tax=Martelella alba TaxID=2590451 RepID=A0ABY2SI13_9HYPH|nr:type VI secretion system protein TssA [Martelella alba]TKI04332.1 type VI secretion system protein TssA [Martelella alba]
MKLEALLAPVSATQPCGENLEYDAECLHMLQMARGKPEQQFGDTLIAAQEPDWRQVELTALRLLARSKDLRILLPLAQAWTAQRALAGYADGLALIAGALERYWESLLPALCQDGEPDPFMRINALRELGEGFTLTRLVRRSPFLRVDGCSLTVAETLRGLEDGGGESRYAGGPARLQQAVRRGISPHARHIAPAIAAAKRILDILRRRLGEGALPEMPALLASLESLAPEHASAPAGDDEPSISDAASKDSLCPAGRRDGGAWREIATREEAVRALAQVKRYFSRFEPGHPAPLLLARIEQLMGQDFMGIIGNLAPSAVAQFEQVLGGHGRE